VFTRNGYTGERRAKFPRGGSAPVSLRQTLPSRKVAEIARIRGGSRTSVLTKPDSSRGEATADFAAWLSQCGSEAFEVLSFNYTVHCGRIREYCATDSQQRMRPHKVDFRHEACEVCGLDRRSLKR
jgi:hypothetical protein